MKNVLALVTLLFITTAFADDGGEGNNTNCNGVGNINSPCQGAPGTPGTDGIDGIDGIDGQDGIDGTNGIDGIDGQDGRDGIDGIDGVVSEEWIKETRYFNTKYANFLAASNAIQIYLPQDQSSRLTLGVGRVGKTTGAGVGYAFKTESGVALTLGIGSAGGEEVGVASVGFEFGGNDAVSRYDAQNSRIQELERQLEIHRDETELVKQLCKESNFRTLEACTRK